MKLDDIHHIINNTQCLVNSIITKRANIDDILMNIDVKQFYLSGSLHELVADCKCKQTWPGEEGRLMEDIIFFILDSQYIKSDIIDGIWHVKKGTGMGLKHSGELTDWIFYNAV